MPPAEHPRISRRTAIQAGSIGLLGLGMNHLNALRAATAAMAPQRPTARAKSVIYIFLSGGLSQLDSFDLKPHAPVTFRSEFSPIATRTPGLQICEHLPLLADRSEHWALVRSLTHPQNEHSAAHSAMLCGQSLTPPGFSPVEPKPTDFPSIAAVAGAMRVSHNNLPPAVVLPERLVHHSGHGIQGQTAGTMGPARDPWIIEACRYNPKSYGAWPQYGFHHERGAENPSRFLFQAPNISLPQGLDEPRFSRRLGLLGAIERQRQALDRIAEKSQFDRYRERAVSLLLDRNTQSAFDVTRAPAAVQDRYGRNTFGWSLLMAKRLVEAGVSLVQVNLGNNETWDTHENMFPHLKNFLLPPADRAVSALLDDLQATGLLDSTLIVMAGEFGRTPRISLIPNATTPGRGHWGSVQSVLFAGGGVRGGAVVGSTDKIGGHPLAEPQTPENMAATIYEALGIPRTTQWHDATERPHQVYSGEPIRGLTG